MYFVPMFDDTDGYYDSTSGVSRPISFFPRVSDWCQCSGGPLGATWSMESSAGRRRGQRWQMGVAPTSAASLLTCQSSTAPRLVRRATWSVRRSIIPVSVANKHAALSTLQYKDAVRHARNRDCELLLTDTKQYGTNLYRPGGLNLPIRMNNILGIASQLDFVEIITWVNPPQSPPDSQSS